MKPEKSAVFREQVVKAAVEQLSRAAQNAVVPSAPRDGGAGGGAGGARWVTDFERKVIEARLRDSFDGITPSEVAEVSRRLGEASADAQAVPGSEQRAAQLAEAAAAARRFSLSVSSSEVVQVDLRESPTVEVDRLIAPRDARPKPLLLSLPPETADRILRAEELGLQRTAFDPLPKPSRLESGTLPDPYEVEPRALLEATGRMAVLLSGHPEHFDPWRAQKNTFDNNWAHAYAGQFAATLFSEAVMTLVGKERMSTGQREVTRAMGDLFGAVVMRAKEELDVHVTPDDVPLTVRRTFRIQLNEREHLEVTPQLTLTAGDMKTFDPTKGSQYFSVRVRFP